MKDFNQQNTLFIRQHWFKISVVILLLYAIFSKDMEIKLEFSKPDAVETVVSQSDDQAAPAAMPAAAGNMATGRTAAGNVTTGRAGTVAATTAQPAQRPAASQHRAEQLNIIGGYSQSAGTEDALYNSMLSVGGERLTALAERFAKVAQAEQNKFGIPASITLASLLLYSQGGKAALVQKGNNFLPCPAQPTG